MAFPFHILPSSLDARPPPVYASATMSQDPHLPEPNPDGSYTFSEKAVIDLRSYLNALKDPTLTHDAVLEYIKEAQAHLPTEQQLPTHQEPPQKNTEPSRNFENLIAEQIREYEAAHYPKSEPPPEKSPELIALENGLNERYDQELKAINLAEAHDCSAAKRHHEMIIHDKLSELSNPTPAQQEAIIEEQFSLLDTHRKQIIETSLAKKEQLKEQLQNASSPQLIALEKALKERHEKEADKLAERQQAELMAADKKDIPSMLEKHTCQQRDLDAGYQSDLTRHRQEDQAAQKLLSRMEEETRKRELTDEPDRPKHSL